MGPLFHAKVLSFEESRGVQLVKDNDGGYSDSKPLENSEKTFLVLELPGGAQIRAEVSPSDFEQAIRPLIENPYKSPMP